MSGAGTACAVAPRSSTVNAMGLTDQKAHRALKHRLPPWRWEKQSMSRIIVALFLVMASTAASWAQGLSPSVWRSERGALLKVVRVDAGGAFSGVFLSGPTNPCPVVPYDMAGGIRGLRVGFQTSRNWTSDCSINAVWFGRFVGPTTIAVRWVATGPGGGRIRGTEVFHRL